MISSKAACSGQQWSWSAPWMLEHKAHDFRRLLLSLLCENAHGTWDFEGRKWEMLRRWDAKMNQHLVWGLSYGWWSGLWVVVLVVVSPFCLSLLLARLVSSSQHVGRRASNSIQNSATTHSKNRWEFGRILTRWSSLESCEEKARSRSWRCFNSIPWFSLPFIDMLHFLSGAARKRKAIKWDEKTWSHHIGSSHTRSVCFAQRPTRLARHNADREAQTSSFIGCDDGITYDVSHYFI